MFHLVCFGFLIGRHTRVRQPARGIHFIAIFGIGLERRGGATCLAALDVLESEPQWMEQLWENTRFFKSGLQALGFDTGISESPITPVIVGDGALAMTLSDQLFEAGVFAQGIAFPTVAKGRARVRTIVTATHSRDELEFALEAFGRVGRKLGVAGRA